MELSLIIYLSGIATFILLAVIGDKKDMDGLLVPSVIIGFLWVVVGFFYSIEATQTKEYIKATPIVTKTPEHVIVEWDDFEGRDRITFYNNHLDYEVIDSNVVWKSIVRKNSWGYHWSDDDDIFYVPRPKKKKNIEKCE